MATILNFQSQKKSFHYDPWPDIYASRQNKNTFLNGMVTATETHDLAGEEMPCAVVMMEHVKGLIPLQESGCTTKNQLKKLMGQIITFKVIALDENSNIFTASRSQAMEAMAAQAWKTIKEGDVVEAIARDVSLKEVTLDISGIIIKMPAREISWGWINDTREIVEPGDTFDVKILKVDKLNKDMQVSIREMLPNPWPEVPNKYKTGRDNEYIGTVTGTPHFGIFVNLEPGVDMLAKQRRDGIRPAIGEKVKVSLNKIDADNKKIEGYITRRLGGYRR